MVNYETGKFKRDVKQRDGKEVVQIRVTGLSVKSEFEDDEDLIIMSKQEFDKLLKQLDTANATDNKAEVLHDNPKYYNQVIDLQNELLISNGKYYAIENNLNTIINEITTEITKLYNTDIATANANSINNIKNLLQQLKDHNDKILNYAYELKKQAGTINDNIDNSSIIKRAFSKDSFKIDLDNEDLDKVISNVKLFNSFDVDSKAKELVQSVEISSSQVTNIIEDTKTKRLPKGNDTDNGNDATADVITTEQSYDTQG